MLSLGSRIRELRLSKGMTQIDLSKDLCTPSMISQIESDRARPSYKVLFAIAERLEVSLDKLLSDVELELEYLSTFKMAQAMIVAREYKAAIPILEHLLEQNDSHLTEIELYHSLGVCQYHTGLMEASEVNLQRVLEMANVREMHDMSASTLLILGLISFQQKRLPVAQHQWLHGLEELRKADTPDPIQELELLTNLAAVFSESGKIKDAVAIYEELVVRYGEAMQTIEIAEIHRKLGESYHRLVQHDKAIFHLEQAIAIYKAMRFQNSLLEVRRQHAIFQGQAGNQEEAIRILEDVAHQYDREGDNISEGITLIELGKIALSAGQLSLTLSYAERAKTLLPEDHPETGTLHRLYANLHFSCGEPSKGIAALRLALQSYRLHNRLAELNQTTQELCESLAKMKSFEDAFQELLGTHALILETLNLRGIML